MIDKMASTLDLEKLRQGWGSALGRTAAQIGEKMATVDAQTDGKTGGAKQTASREDYPVTQVYDKNHDYMADMQRYVDMGDYASAARAEQQRNSKITGEGLDPSLYTNLYSQYLPENRYNFDPTQNEEYQKYAEQQQALFDKIMNRGDFRYNAEADPLYQQYRDQYTTLGQQAMRDTMGQAAGLTGGYGSTYAQQAGQQAYEGYLQRLNDVMPELYNAAWSRWNNEGDRLQAQYNLVDAQRQDVYNRDYTNWANMLNLQREDEQNAQNRYWTQEQQEYERQQDAANQLMSLISATGYNPTDAELKAAGLSREKAEALRNAYLQALYASNNSGSGGGSGSGRRSSGRRSSGGGGYPDYTPDTGPTAEEAYQQTVQQCYSSLKQSVHYGASRAQLLQQISNWLSSGLINEATADEMAAKYNLDV